jgi:hypothetical protein
MSYHFKKFAQHVTTEQLLKALKKAVQIAPAENIEYIPEHQINLYLTNI